MSPLRVRPGLVVLAVYLGASAVTAVIAGRAVVKRALADRVRTPATPSVAIIASPGPPINAEAAGFRTTPASVAIEPTTERNRSAHPRNLRTFRFLRGYPGAPPRIPHGVTAEEFRVGACRECHDRGGYSLRFAAYVPITPHPEMGMCLQCHVGVDSVMGALVPGADPNTRCTQCHGPSGGRPRADASATWSAAVWPALGRRGGQKPLPIPHGLLFREDCNACHAGPGAVAEIRTSHPGRTYCRDCHVTQDPDVVSFDRRPRSAEPSAGDGR